MLIETLDRSLLGTFLSPRFVERGEDYHRRGRVLAARWRRIRRSEVVTGRVAGSEDRVYTVHVVLSREGRGRRLSVEGDCTCPVGYNCKHVAAVIFAARAAGEAEGATGSAAGTESAARARAPIDDWLARLEAARHAGAGTGGDTILLYVLERAPAGHDAGPGTLVVRPMACRTLARGGQGTARPFDPRRAWQAYPPRFLGERDLEVLRNLGTGGAPLSAPGAWRLEGETGAHLLREVLATGRCRWEDPTGRALALGAPRTARFAWALDADGRQRLRPDSAPEPGELVGVAPPWYLDLERGRCGPLETGLAPAVAAALLAAPPLEPADARSPPEALVSTLDELGLPRPRALEVRGLEVAPVPCLRLVPAEHPSQAPASPDAMAGDPFWWRPRLAPRRARLHFDYGGHAVAPGGDPRVPVRVAQEDRIVEIRRDPEAEDRAEECLLQCGLEPYGEPPAGPAAVWPGRAGPPAASPAPLDFVLPPDLADGVPEDRQWLAFVHRDVPWLRSRGFRVEVDPDFDVRLVTPEQWYGSAGAAETEGPGAGWLDVELGIVAGGERISLLPILHDILTSTGGRDTVRALEAAEADDEFLVRTPDGVWIALPAARVRGIVETLVELADPQGRLGAGGRLRVHARRAADLAALETEGGAPLRWEDPGRLAALAERLRGFERVEPRAAPASVDAALRPYQAHGLGWLQFLRETGFGGILADDMGLGKTLQALAHLATEHEAGRLDRPSLVVAPTSVLAVWAAEARRFVPGLRVLVLHGPARQRRFPAIPEHDLVVTSYPLAVRDREALAAHAWHLLVLDEAQAIKNPRAKAAEALRSLEARQRLCLTGTPLENHLGELWSLVDFVEPGLLGGERQFRRLFRTPVEKWGDDARREILARRIAPFVLRRTKEQVLDELPEKVEIDQPVDLDEAQRDLYESIRVSVLGQVQAALAERGLERSRVQVLDALLKLRQVCCDPRLVKLAAARRVRRSAKLDALVQMLPELIDEGRRVLLFSQFTGMLALIEESLAGAGIEWVKLTGRTRDRETPVRRFQAGEVPLFLVSLKAGGTGLNLTAADTVIHYDPWWNPAVETQATDRAHRIGQDKKVFVYRLVAAGTVEERILALHARKRRLARSVLGGRGAGGAVDLTREDLERLLEPLGG